MSNSTILKIINIGKEMLRVPVVLLDDVGKIFSTFSRKQNHRLVVATKGDLLDQERKIEKSGFAHYFDHIEVMSNKEPLNYRKLVQRLGIQASNLIMVGNSVKSDILRVLGIGGAAFHIPIHTTWEHERVNNPVSHPKFRELKSILELEKYL